MASRIDHREAIATALKGFEGRPLGEAARDLFTTLGYKSDRRLPIATTRQFYETLDPNGRLTDREREALDQAQSPGTLWSRCITRIT